MIFIELFFTFFLIGTFTIGGGYAMLSLIQHQVVTVHGWITDTAFADMVAVSQMTPGPIGINSATYIGYSVIESTGAGPLMGMLGSFTATFAVILPSFLIVLFIVKTYNRIRGNNLFKGTMKGLRPVVIGLIGSAALVLIFDVDLSGDGYRVEIIRDNFSDWKSWAIAASAFVAAFRFKVHPILIIAASGLSGWLLF